MTRLHLTFWLSLVIKLILAALLPLTNDEAYYWVWAQHMQLSFYDHPPVVAWLFWLGDRINIYGSMVRWPGILLGQTTLWIWLLLLKPFFSQEQLFYWLLLALFSPLIGGTNIIVTPDLPLLFFYALSLLVFYRWREKSTAAWSLAFGLSMGLGFSAKYMMVLLPLSLFPLILLSKRVRRPFLSNIGWIGLGLLVGSLPVWLWNLRNDFASFRFQADHGLGQTVWKPSWTIEYVLAQVGLIFPVVLYWAVQSRRRLPRIFHLLAWIPLLFFLFTTLRGYVEANWPIVAYPAIFALAVASFPRNVQALQSTITIWAVLIGALATVIVTQPEWARPLKFREFNQFDTLTATAHDLEPLFARSYQMAAKMHFALKRPIFKLRGMNRKDFYDYLEGSEPQTKSFYLAVEKSDSLPIEFTARGFKVRETKPVDDTFEIWRVEAP